MDFVRRHGAACVLAILIGMIAAGPYVYVALTTPHYAGIAMLGQASEEYYVTRIKEVYDGDPLIHNAYLPFKQVPYIVPSLGEDALAYTGMALHLSAVEVNLWSKLLLPFVACLLLYALVYRISGSVGAGMFAAACALLGLDILSNPADLLHLLRGTVTASGLFWSRPINPELSGVCLFGSLLVLYRAYGMHLPRRWWHPIVLGLLIGCTLYISIYIWLFLGVLVALWCLSACWWREWGDAQELFLAGALALALSIPFISNYLQAKTYADYANVQIQQGVLPLHTPSLGVWALVLCVLPLLVWPKRFADARRLFVLSGVALLLVLNQQLVTGIYEQPAHFHSYITKPLVCVLLALYAAWGMSLLRSVVVRRALYAAGIAVLLVFGLLLCA